MVSYAKALKLLEGIDDGETIKLGTGYQTLCQGFLPMPDEKWLVLWMRGKTTNMKEESWNEHLRFKVADMAESAQEIRNPWPTKF